MLERLISAVIITTALAGTPSCATIGPVQEQTLESAFYTEKKVLEEQKGEISILYKYKNGIEAEVTYKKNERLSDIYINILADPNNVLVRGIPVSETPPNASIQEMVDGEEVKTAIDFTVPNSGRVSIKFRNREQEYVKVGERDYVVPFPLKAEGQKHLKRIEEYLDFEAHRRILKAMPAAEASLPSLPTSSKTQSF